MATSTEHVNGHASPGAVADYWAARARDHETSPLKQKLPKGKASLVSTSTEHVHDHSSPWAFADYWVARTRDHETRPFKPKLPKGKASLVSTRMEMEYDPALYRGTACESWCDGEVSVDRSAAEAAGRTHFPPGDVADWAEKCTWDAMVKVAALVGSQLATTWLL